MLTDPFRLLLAPILIWQGYKLGRTIPRLPEPVGERVGIVGDGAAISVLIIGDSSAAGVGVETQDDALLGQIVDRLAASHRVAFNLVAWNGAKTPAVFDRLRSMEAKPVDVAVIALGVNDAIGGTSCPTWLRQYGDLVQYLREEWSVKHIVASGLPPVRHFPALPEPLRWVLGRRVQQFDRALHGWANSVRNTDYIDFTTQPGHPLHGVPLATLMADDGFHPGPAIYALWADRVAGFIEAQSS